jgi:hypothetical protein
MRRGYASTEGSIRGNVELRVSADDMKEWTAEDIEAFFAAIAQAKRIVERNHERRDKANLEAFEG